MEVPRIARKGRGKLVMTDYIVLIRQWCSVNVCEYVSSEQAVTVVRTIQTKQNKNMGQKINLLVEL